MSLLNQMDLHLVILIAPPVLEKCFEHDVTSIVDKDENNQEFNFSIDVDKMESPRPTLILSEKIAKLKADFELMSLTPKEIDQRYSIHPLFLHTSLRPKI